jgi:tetratricopeptide repeat protein 21B
MCNLILNRNYLEARKLMADIYLVNKKDRKRYTSCFREVVERSPTIDTCLLLGEAYMKIQEPEQAISVYQVGAKMYKSSVFSEKIGQAYAKTHDFAKVFGC